MFYNKPNGMAHFLKNAYPPVTEAVIALVDPDMILMSALTPYVGETGLRPLALDPWACVCGFLPHVRVHGHGAALTEKLDPARTSSGDTVYAPCIK